MLEKYFKGTGNLIALIFRQQRFKIFIWTVILVGITLAVAKAYPDIYPDEASRNAAYMTLDNPAMVAMLGIGYELEDYVSVIGAVFATEMLLFTAIAFAIMSILLVAQATRGDEETGRVEMIQALSVGKLSYTTAVMFMNVSTNVLLALLIGFGIRLLNIEGMELSSSLLYGATLGATGIAFGAFTAMFAQLSESVRTTTMFSLFVLIGAYLLRAVGDVSNEVLSSLSPLGWTVRTGVFVDDNWWPVILLCLLAMILGMIAFYLQAIRDVGAGIFAARNGRPNASVILQNPLGLNFWMQKTNISAWLLVILALSGSFGAILGELETYLVEIDIIGEFIDMNSEDTLAEQFVALIIAIMTLIATIPAVITVLKLKSEEKNQLTENIYSRAVSRVSVLSSYILLAVIVSFLMQTMIALGLWSASQSVMEDALSFQSTFKAAYVYLPAIWVVIGSTVILIGVVPKLTSLIWLYIAYCFVVLYLGGMLDFPEWMNQLSLYHYVPQIPIDEMNMTITFSLTMLAIGLSIIGSIAYRKRDLIG